MNSINEEIKVPLSNKKIVLLFIGSLVFVTLGVWLLNNPSKFSNSAFRQRSPEIIMIAGITCIAFFGVCGIFAFKKLFDKKDGLIFNAIGIIDNSNANSTGIIKWVDIIGISVIKVYSQKFIAIEIRNPEHYIELNKDRLGKMAMDANFKSYGMPINISANMLEINFDELKDLVETQYEKYKHQ